MELSQIFKNALQELAFRGTVDSLRGILDPDAAFLSQVSLVPARVNLVAAEAVHDVDDHHVEHLGFGV